MILIKNRQFYKTVLTIGIPIALQNLITFSVSLADTVMLSRASHIDELVSAADLANKTMFLLIITLFGLTGGGVVLASQYWGKGDMKSIRKITAMILHMGFIISCAMGAAVLLFPSGVMAIFTKDAIIIEKGAEYLSIVGWSYFLLGISTILMIMLRSVEVVKIALLADIAALVLSISLNWVLIFGNLGFPALGIRGAAISTLIARTVSFLIAIIYVFFIDKRLQFRIKDIWCFDAPLFRDILKYGFPVLFHQVAWAMGITVQAMIIGHIDYAAGNFIAANAATGVIFHLFMVAMFGMSNAAIIIVGKSIGEGKPVEAQDKAQTLFTLSFMMGILVCSVILITRNATITVFMLSPETDALARELLVYVAFLAFFTSIASMSLAGIFRGGGDTRVCLIIEMTCMWGVAIPLATLCAFVFKLPIPVVYIAMKIDEVIKVIICSVRIRGNTWIRNLTVDRREPA